MGFGPVNPTSVSWVHGVPTEFGTGNTVRGVRGEKVPSFSYPGNREGRTRRCEDLLSRRRMVRGRLYPTKGGPTVVRNSYGRHRATTNSSYLSKNVPQGVALLSSGLLSQSGLRLEVGSRIESRSSVSTRGELVCMAAVIEWIGKEIMGGNLLIDDL